MFTSRDTSSECISLILRVLSSDKIPGASATGMFTKDTCEVEGWGNESEYRAWSEDGVRGLGRVPLLWRAFAWAGARYGGSPLESEGSCVECSGSAVGDWDSPDKPC